MTFGAERVGAVQFLPWVEELSGSTLHFEELSYPWGTGPLVIEELAHG